VALAEKFVRVGGCVGSEVSSTRATQLLIVGF